MSSDNYIDSLPRDIRELLAAYAREADERRRAAKLVRLRQRVERKKAEYDAAWRRGAPSAARVAFEKESVLKAAHKVYKKTTKPKTKTELKEQGIREGRVG